MEASLRIPEMVGRERELEKLTKHLDDALEGRGSAVFISGEAGIGKTRLVEELKKVAQSKGFLVLSGYSMYESLTPYMPFFEALKSGGLEALFAEEAPRVEGVYLVTNTGLLVKEVVREETNLEPNIFASMLSTVDDFIEASFTLLGKAERRAGLNRLSRGEYTILVEKGEATSLMVVLTGKENEFVINDMRETLVKVHKFCGNALRDWDGNEDSVHGVDRLLSPLIASRKYDGVYYGKHDPRARRNLLFENVSLGLTRQARVRPTLLCIEDLQWSDPSTLALMHYIARNTTEYGLVIIGSYRPEDLMAEDGRVHHLVETMQRMRQEDLYAKLELGRLSKSGVTILLASALGAYETGKGFDQQIYQGTEGNPLFVLELLKLAIADSIIKKDNGKWKVVRSITGKDIPSKVYDAVARRLDRLEYVQREIIDIGSVCGEEFSVEILASVLNIESMHLSKMISILEQKHRLIHSHEGHYRFDHVKIKEVSYCELSPTLRAEYHGRTAEAIEKHNSSNLDEIVGDLAFHYLRSRNPKEAFPHLIRAAEIAKEQYSNEEAALFYTEALGVEDDNEKRQEIYKSLGAVYEVTGDYEKQYECYEQALRLAKGNKRRAELTAKIGGNRMQLGKIDEGRSICERALSLVEGERCSEEATALHIIGLTYYEQGMYDKALDHYMKALEIRQEINDKEGISGTMNNIGSVYGDQGDVDKAIEYYEKSLAIREEINDLHGIASSLTNLGVEHAGKGEYETALEYYNRSVEISERTGHQHILAIQMGGIGGVHWNRSDYDQALEYFVKSLRTYERIGNRGGIACALNNIGNVYADLGDYEKALDHYNTSLEISKGIGHQLFQANNLTNIGSVHVELGDYIQALDFYEKSRALMEKIGTQWGLSEVYCGFAEAHLGRGDVKSALEFHDLALISSESSHRSDNIARAHRIRGVIHRERGMWSEATESFRESLRIYKETGEKYGMAKSNYEFGLMWMAKKDYVQAKEHLGAAVDVLSSIGAKRELEKARVAYEGIMNERHFAAHEGNR